LTQHHRICADGETTPSILNCAFCSSLSML
jgi:hypothetical protein